MKQLQIILIWILGITFIVLGFLKYIDHDEMSRAIFTRAHYPRWFFYIVATIEFIGGIMLLMTAATSKRLGSVMIGLVMLGAIVTRYILNEHYTHFILPGIILLIAILMSVKLGGKEESGESV
jgi:uncharacterized membrane protein YphA (DoxX/SURF4 family)